MADSERWERWLARHGPGLVLFARQWTGNVFDAEDAVQDGFVRFWRSRGGARDPVALLYACVRTAAIDLTRSQRRRGHCEHRHIAGDAAAFDPGHAELAEAVEAALATLSPEQREVVVMKIWGGLTFAQIGEASGVSFNTAASRYRYAMQRLGERLSQEVAHE